MSEAFIRLSVAAVLLNRPLSSLKRDAVRLGWRTRSKTRKSDSKFFSLADIERSSGRTFSHADVTAALAAQSSKIIIGEPIHV